jgi:hypothetical protein
MNNGATDRDSYDGIPLHGVGDFEGLHGWSSMDWYEKSGWPSPKFARSRPAVLRVWLSMLEHIEITEMNNRDLDVMNRLPGVFIKLQTYEVMKTTL